MRARLDRPQRTVPSATLRPPSQTRHKLSAAAAPAAAELETLADLDQAVLAIWAHFSSRFNFDCAQACTQFDEGVGGCKGWRGRGCKRGWRLRLLGRATRSGPGPTAARRVKATNQPPSHTTKRPAPYPTRHATRPFSATRITTLVQTAGRSVHRS